MHRWNRLVSALADRVPLWWDRPWAWRIGWGREGGFTEHSLAGVLWDLHGRLVALDPGWALRRR